MQCTATAVWGALGWRNMHQLQVLTGQCSEEVARVLIPVSESLLSALRGSTNESL